MEYEPKREPPPAPPRVGRVLLLAGMALTSYSLIRNEGEAGALTATGCAGLGIGVAHLIRQRKR